jgi:hypothetical protein
LTRFSRYIWRYGFCNPVNIERKKMKRLKGIIILLACAVLCTSFTDKPTHAEIFMNKASAFIKKNYAKSFSYIDETVHYQGMFESMTEADWAGTVTLKSKKAYQEAGKKPFHKRMFYSFYYYDDTNKVKLCYDTLVHCFPPECTKLKPHANAKNFTHMASVYILNRHSIITLQVNCPELPANWETIKTTLLKNFREKHSTTITTDCDAMLLWKTIP